MKTKCKKLIHQWYSACIVRKVWRRCEDAWTQCAAARCDLASQRFRSPNIYVINSMIVRIMTCMWLPSCECATN